MISGSAVKETEATNQSNMPRPNAEPHREAATSPPMWLELEEKQARIRLAEAELQVAEARAKVEAARHAVIEHKLKMARAGMRS
ncbi:hypothetical protein M407DRAFT_32380 [Tulasnella calospora MUT 4182]|uniref:Uncharacterized protein n=1 Tax=Tulasnella calospora MUT 4182 TaxID=1051891 RepID=A0A0C3L917_9AGAM|nr:hypothetical protein M407DRAFT_32380 [Tulasnella calospora MUT 4182]